jgi:pyrroloquinoline quinone biosynthesis protein E
VLVAELTYRCPLRCAYCSNPIEVQDRAALAGADWQRVLNEASELGVVQVHFTGGEPLLRDDLEALVTRAAQLELYSNLITSGVPLTRERLAGLQAAGLCALQLSFQAARPGASAAIAGVDAFEHKRQVAAWTRELDLPLTVNVVLHRQNLDDVDAMAQRHDGRIAERGVVDLSESGAASHHQAGGHGRNDHPPSRSHPEHGGFDHELDGGAG